ncbi:MAG TPA: dihydrodipicolinate synthase family protein [Gemmatimonadota bacterium]|nr:dihydrodipicolinate synthase family protein [Gemmatimonadota bacterium]
MTPPLRGLLCPVTTPFDPGGDASPDRLAAQIEIYQRLGVHGAVVFGTSGEGPLIDADEEARLLAAARSALASDRAFVVQVGHESLRATLASARRAETAGADALLCLPPRYYPLGAAGIARFYRAVAGACGLPLLAYHIPQLTHVDPGSEILCELASDGTLVGIKDSAGDIALQRALRKAGGDGFAIFNGSARLTLESLRQGADGAILAVSDAVPERVLAILDAHAAGDGDSAEVAQRAIGPLADCVGARYGVPGIKAALDLRGWPGGGAPRAPLAALGRTERDEIRAALLVAGVDLS